MNRNSGYIDVREVDGGITVSDGAHTGVIEIVGGLVKLVTVPLWALPAILIWLARRESEKEK